MFLKELKRFATEWYITLCAQSQLSEIVGKKNRLFWKRLAT